MHDWAWAWKRMQAGDYVHVADWGCGIYWSFRHDRQEIWEWREGRELTENVGPIAVAQVVAVAGEGWELYQPAPEAETAVPEDASVAQAYNASQAHVLHLLAENRTLKDRLRSCRESREQLRSANVRLRRDAHLATEAVKAKGFALYSSADLKNIATAKLVEELASRTDCPWTIGVPVSL